MRFYRSNQPWGKGGVPHVSRTRLIPITQTSNSLFVPSPFLTYLKPNIVIAFFFPFLGLLGNKPFSSHCHKTQLAVWALCTAFPLFSFVLQTCVCSKDSIGGKL